MNIEHVADLKALLRSEVATRQIVLDLKDLTLVNRGVVIFLKRCETDSIELKNCPATSASGSRENDPAVSVR